MNRPGPKPDTADPSSSCKEAHTTAAALARWCVPLTSNLKWANAPSNVLLPRHETRLAKDSVANVSLIVALDKQQLDESHSASGHMLPLERVSVSIDIS
jgi:mRNA interferase MazF